MFVGIDGGGTKTAVVIIDAHQNIIAEASGGPSGIRAVGFADALKNIEDTLTRACSNLKNPNIKCVFAGIADISSEHDAHKISSALSRLDVLKHAVVHAGNDVVNAHMATLEGKPGIVLIAGTGSVAYGVNARGDTHRAGGFSYKEGDPGSAYDLGRLALSVFSRTLDGRREANMLSKTLQKHLRVGTYVDAVGFFDTYGHDRMKIAGIAKVVTALADEGDALAQSLCERAAEALVEMVEAVSNALDLSASDVGIVGSLATSPTYFRTRLMHLLRHSPNRFNPVFASKGPAYGAALVAHSKHS